MTELKATLTIIQQSAEAQVDSSFDASGTSGQREDSSTPQSSDRARSWNGDIRSEESELSTLSQSLDSLGVSSENSNETTEIITNSQYVSELEKLSAEDKTTRLIEMFPTVKLFDVKYVSKKVDFHFGKAVEELLTHVFFEKEDEKESPGGNPSAKKGIDAFLAPETPRGRKPNRKKKGQTRGANSTSSPLTQPSVTLNSWDRAKEEVNFIKERTFLTHQTVSSVYHKSGASLAPTIVALCGTSSTLNPYLASASRPILDAHAEELLFQFPSLSLSQATALVCLTHPSTTSAHELARVLATFLDKSSRITPHYLLRPPSPPLKDAPETTPASLPAASVSQLASARDIAFAKAHAAHRKSKSNPLMGGAATYYSSVGRETSATIRRHEAASAERLVTAQSKPGEVDFHGVRVQDAVRMAREKVEGWWENEGGEWARKGKAMTGGLKIVTGIGRHSQGGKGRLGPAVGAMLVREGWKVSFGEGFLVVLGKARR